MLESTYVSYKNIMSKLCREVYAFKSENFEKLWAEMLFKILHIFITSECVPEDFHLYTNRRRPQ